MLPLNNISIWQKLSSPFGCAENLPTKILDLKKTESEELMNEICWEDIYHQGSLYQCTIASFPHLLEIIRTSQNEDFCLELYTNLGAILIELDAENRHLKQIIFQGDLDNESKQDIYKSFLIALNNFSTLKSKFEKLILDKDDFTKSYFIVTLAVIHKQFEIGKMLCVFYEAEEYMSICPHCSNEFYLWNEDKKLNLYPLDPVSNKSQKPIMVTPKKIEPSSLLQSTSKKEWFVFNVQHYNIEILKPILPYLTGSVICPKCNTKYEILDSILNAVN